MKRWLRLTQEETYGVFDTTSPVQIHIRLDQPDSFSVMTSPEFWTLMSGSGFAVPALMGSETAGLAATLQTPLHYSQASFLLGWALTRINSAKTLPWTTTEAVGDLPSVTCDFAWTNFDGSIRRKRFLGCKVATLGLTATRDAPPVRLSLGLLGGTPQGNIYDSSSDPDATALPEPAESVFPTDVVVFQHLRGGYTLNNQIRTNFESLNFSVQNRIKAYFDESRYANAIRIGGRTTTISSRVRLKATPDDRALYEAATNLAAVNRMIFSNGTHTITLDLGTRDYISQYQESLPIDEEIYASMTITNMMDPANVTINPDFTWSYT